MKLRNRIIVAAVVLMCGAIVCENSVKADENRELEIKVSEHDGEIIATNGESPIYTTKPLDFEILSGDTGEIYYSISFDGGRNFTNVEKVNASAVTLYPEMAAGSKDTVAIKFMGIKKEDIGNNGLLLQNGVFVQSDVYKVVFEYTPAVIEIDNEKLLQNRDFLPLLIRKENGYIVRIVASLHGQVIYEKRFDSKTAVREYEISIPYVRNYFLQTDDKIMVSVEDEFGKYSEAQFGYEDVLPKEAEKRDANNTGKSENDADGKEDNYESKESNEIDTAAPILSVLGVEDGQVVKGECNIEIESIEDNYEGGCVSVQLQRSALGKNSQIPIDDYELMAVCDKRSISLKRDGEYDLHVRATDGCNNTCEVTKHFYIDNTSPDIKITGIGENNVASIPLQVNVCVREMFYEDANVDVLLSKKDAMGQFIQVMSKSYGMKASSDCITLPELTDGEYKMVVTSTDIGKNISRTEQVFKVDTISPIMGELSDIDGKYFDSFRLKKTDYKISDLTKVNVTATLNGADITENDVIIGEGKYKLRLSAVDEAGNTSEREATFIIDHTPPQIVIEGVDRKGNLRFGKLVSVSLFDNEDMLKSVSYNGRNIAIKDNKAFVKIDSIGDLSLKISAKDDAGNEINREIRAYSHN